MAAATGSAAAATTAATPAGAPTVEEENQVPKIPDLGLSQLYFLLQRPSALVTNADQAKKDLLTGITEKNMAPFYKLVCAGLKWPVDQALLTNMREANEKELKRLDDVRIDAEKNLGESEIREALLAKANYYATIGDKENAISAFRATTEKTVAGGQKLDIVFTLIRVGLFFRDHDLTTKSIARAKADIEAGGDWDRRNRLKVYEGVHAMELRNFKKASALFLDTLATFASTELFTFTTFVFYTVMLGSLHLDRPNIKTKILNSPEVLSVIHEVPHLGSFAEALYHCNYATLFRSLAVLQQRAKLDMYFAAHAAFYVRETRIKAYAQLLQSYKSVQLASMAHAFGISAEFLDRELSRFIASGRLHCKVDKVAGIVETTRPESRNSLYGSTIKDGDLLLNRIQKLSRVINL
jgi:26S proteasome regulatory subunit N7